MTEYLDELERQTQRADALAADLRELRENVLLGLGMTAEDVAAMEDGMIEPSIAYLLAGHKELAAEVERLEVDRDEWMETAETTEGELCRFMDDLIAVVGEQVIVGDEVKFSAIVTAVAALRAQLEAAGEGWRPVTEKPTADGPNYEAIVKVRWEGRLRNALPNPGAFVTHGGAILGDEHVIGYRPTPPQE